MTSDGEDRDEVWFEQLYRSWHGQVLGYARRRVPEPDDLVAEVFAAAWRHRGRVTDPPLPWLLRTAHNYVMHAARTARRRERLAVKAGHREPVATIDHADTVVARQAASSTVLAGLRTLSVADQELLRLSAWEQLTVAEVAVVMECSEVAARVRLHRARRRLQAAIGPLSETHPSTRAAVEVQP